ncbi:pentapeptide repeat-containing protein [Hyalangium sp.]|uniref:pentapeptide repeat-containing protein n=1 Tax=Hyalangium sp. TaxID=2028555 RepID=UPI002D43166B|nr:pentapeptide repeat-containing protein [Hyalangium sp.]HYH99203.1 pentapeptide repeat-containing protein [Hyalangium sp.]
MQPTVPIVDFLIITALEEERAAVLTLLAGHRLLERDGQDPHTYYEAQVRSARSDGAVYRVLVTSLVGMGPVQAATQASSAVHRWHPRHVLMVGIAGGVGSMAELGDVLVASQLADSTQGKQTPERRKIRWEVHRADADLLDAAFNFPHGWEDLLTLQRPGAGLPRRRIGVILSGGDVIADAQALQLHLETWDKLVGVEMEGGGVALALHNTQERPRFLMVRGVSDLADEQKGSAEVRRWREYACAVAAAYTVGLIRSGLIAPAALPVAQAPPLAAQPPALPALPAPPSFSGMTFEGRDEELERLREHLVERSHEAPGRAAVVGLRGIGGIGKTALAMVFAERHASSFPGGILWADLGTNSDVGERGANTNPAQVLLQVLRRWAVELGSAPLPLHTSLDEVLGLVRRDLAQRERFLGRCLLVLDNVDTEKTLRPMLQGFSFAAMLITTRQTALASQEGMSRIDLGALPRPASVAYLRKELGADARTEKLESLLDSVGDHPLALRLIASLLKRDPQLAPATILRRMRDTGHQHSPLPALTHVPASLADCFEVSIQALPRGGAYPFLISTASQSPLGWSLEAAHHVSGTGDLSRTRRYVELLLDHGLVERQAEGVFRIHRLLMDYLRAVHGASGFGFLRPSWELPVVASLLMRWGSDISAGTPNYDLRQERFFLRLVERRKGASLRADESDGLLLGLSRKCQAQNREAAGKRIRSLRQHLAGIDLSGLRLERVMLDGANLKGARLTHANLSGEKPRLFLRAFEALREKGFRNLILSSLGTTALLVLVLLASLVFWPATSFFDFAGPAAMLVLGTSALAGASELLVAFSVSGGRLLDPLGSVPRTLLERGLVIATYGGACAMALLVNRGVFLDSREFLALLLCVFVTTMTLIMAALSDRLILIAQRKGVGGLSLRLIATFGPLVVVAALASSLILLPENRDLVMVAFDAPLPLIVLSLSLLPAPYIVLRSLFRNPEVSSPLYSVRTNYLRKACLQEVDLRFAKLMHARLQGADLTGADLTGADLSGAQLRDAIVRGANLAGATLVQTSLEHADLRGADLRGVDLSQARLQGAMLEGVLQDEHTRWPGLTGSPRR